MKLYATVTSERATKGQGGEYLDIEIMGENKEEIARIKVTKPPYIDYEITVYPVAYPEKLMIDVKGHGYNVTRKGKKQKGECTHDNTTAIGNDLKCLECGQVFDDSAR